MNSKTFAIITDIHSNFASLKHALKIIESKNDIDKSSIKLNDIIKSRKLWETLVEFSHAWYKRDDKPPSAKEAMSWRKHVIEENPLIKKVVFVHGHVHVPRHQIIENLTILCQGATGLPFDRDQRGSVAFLTIRDDEIHWDVNRYDYDRDYTTNGLEKRKPPFYINLKNTIKFASIRNDL